MKKRFLTVCGISLCMAATLAGCGEEKEAVAEARTEAATAAKTEAPAEAVTEASTEAKTEEKTEAATEAKTEAATEAKKEEDAEDADQAPADPNSFYEFVSNPSAYSWEGFGAASGESFNWDSFALIDFDGDNTPELVASCLSDDRPDAGMQHYVIVDESNSGLVFSEIADGVASAGGYRGTIYYIPGESIIYDLSNNAPTGAPGTTIYTFENGKVEYKEGGYCEPDMEADDPSDWSKGTWYWGTDAISQDEYDSKVNAATENQSGQAFNEIVFMDKDSMLKSLQN